MPLPPGTASDFLARVVGERLGDAYKQQIVVDNRPGAGGLIGSSLLTKATADGYTYAMIAPPHVVAPMLRKDPPYHPLKNVTPVMEVAVIANVLMVAPRLPAKNVKELVALAKSKPGQLNYASVGVGTIAHIAAAIFNHAAGIDDRPVGRAIVVTGASVRQRDLDPVVEDRNEVGRKDRPRSVVVLGVASDTGRG